MAGSYNHVVDDDGRLLDGEGINSMLECMSGDVVECVEEMYGMIWWLADRLEDHIDASPDDPDTEGMDIVSAKGLVEKARQHYEEGLRLSPGTGAHLPPEDDD